MIIQQTGKSILYLEKTEHNVFCQQEVIRNQTTETALQISFSVTHLDKCCILCRKHHNSRAYSFKICINYLHYFYELFFSGEWMSSPRL